MIVALRSAISGGLYPALGERFRCEVVVERPVGELPGGHTDTQAAADQRGVGHTGETGVGQEYLVSFGVVRGEIGK